ncbi:MAG: hypothetical protein EXS52_00700 [Candidatus Staskawiczbacteria bacterium]|nr:hypothetical protein [Candidatus Staskawiczbacteria bacterium]
MRFFIVKIDKVAYALTMNIIKQYVDYLKDNPQNLWFKRKLYGWGWTPATWQGWLIIVMFIAYLIWNAIVLDHNPSPTTAETTWFFVKTVLAVGLVILICYKKGEKPRWQMGSDKKENNIK